MATGNGGAGDPNVVVVYIDGCCINNGTANAYAGYGINWPDFPHWNKSKPLSGEQTNGRAELMAAIVALKQANKLQLHDRLIIYSDSTYVVNSARFWISGWKENGWRLANGKPADNLDLIQELDELIELVRPKWRKVEAHSGDPNNEQADELAKDGAAKNPLRN